MKNFIFGIHSVIEAIKANKAIDKVMIRENLKGETISELTNLLKDNNTPIQYVPLEKLNRTTSSNHQGVIAIISPVEYFNLEDIVISTFESGKTPIFIILDNLTDVRNFGAIARTAECAGIDAIIIPSKNSVSITPDSIKTSSGALARIPVCRENNLTDTLILLQQMGIKVIAATEKASKVIYEEDMNTPIAIVLGSEDKGVSGQLLRKADVLVKIPIYGNTDSLNVSVAAGIIIYEVQRQRNF